MKIRLTKGELKRQRDGLTQYQRYLPTLLLKKQQLQMEILHSALLLEEKNKEELSKTQGIRQWQGLLKEEGIDIKHWVRPKEVFIRHKNIAGVDFPVFETIEFAQEEYDFFTMPLWVDHAIEALRDLCRIRKEVETIEKTIEILKHELRITTQRVNLFEKVKIPDAKEAIRQIKIYIGDQMVNAIVRSKIAKKKIEEFQLQEANV